MKKHSDKNIFERPFFSEEEALIFAMCKFVFPEDSERYARELLRGKYDPFLVFHEVSMNYCDNSTYKKMRLNAFLKMIHILKIRGKRQYKNVNLGNGVRLNTVERMLEHVYSSFDMSSAEKLLLLCLNDRFVCRKAYETNTWDRYSCSFPEEVLTDAIRANSPCRLILVHSHPSFDTEPSQTDYQSSVKIKDLAECMGSELFEHFIISGDVRSRIYSTVFRPKKVYEERTFSEVMKKYGEN